MQALQETAEKGRPLRVWWRLHHCTKKHLVLDTGMGKLACGGQLPHWSRELCPPTTARLRDCLACTRALEKHPGLKCIESLTQRVC